MGAKMLSLKKSGAPVNPPKPQTDRVSPIRLQPAADRAEKQGASLLYSSARHWSEGT